MVVSRWCCFAHLSNCEKVMAAIVELKPGQSLYSDRTGRSGVFNGKTEYTNNENKLISKGQKAIAIIQQDGNFVIRTGIFDANGNPKRPNGTFEPDPNLYKLYTTEVWASNPVFDLWGKTGFDKAPFEIKFTDSTFEIRSLTQGLVKKFEVGDLNGYTAYGAGYKLVVSDEGFLEIYKNNGLIWTTKPMPQPIAPVVITPSPVQNQTTGSQTNPVIPANSTPLTIFGIPLWMLAAGAGFFIYRNSK